MKIKCPGCSKVLNIPDTMAGKVVKCPSCSKQLRTPAAKPGSASSPQATPQQPQARPSAPAAAPVQPAPAAPVQPAPIQPAPAQPTPQSQALPSYIPPPPEKPADFGSGGDVFAEITDQDLSGVSPVTRPGAKTSSGPSGMPADSIHAQDETGSRGDSDGQTAKTVFMVIGGIAVIAAGIGIIVWYLMGGESEDSSPRIRRRSPIAVGIGLIITGIGWIGGALGIFSND